MNWTGGRLSRHSRNANSAVAQRQKKHFARARSNLLNGPSKTGPIKWSLFHAVDPAAREDGSKLNTTPRYPRHSPSDLAPGIQDALPQKRRLENSFETTLRDGTFQDVGKLSSEFEPPGTSLFNRVSRQDFLHRELPGSHGKIGRHELPAGEAPGCNDPNLEADTLEDRRRKILCRIDWVGANIQRPIKLKFITTGNDGRLGKRRKITGSNCGAITQPMISSTFSKSAPKHNPERSPRTRNVSDSRFEAPPKSRVRISIGGRHVAAGATSSTNRSKKVGGHLESSQASISDEMLLDGDDMNRQHSLLLQESQDRNFYCESSHLATSAVVGNGSFSPSLAHRLSYAPYRKKTFPSYDKSDSIVEQPVTPEFIGLAERVPTIWTGLNNVVADVPWQINNSNLSGSSHQYRRFVETVNPNLVTLRAHGKRSGPNSTSLENADVSPIGRNRRLSEISPPCPRFISDIPKQFPSTAIRLHFTSRDKLRKNARFDYQPELFHPIPLTSRISQVLCHALSESDSTVAQIGIDHISTKSQLLDEEIWKTWVLSSPEVITSGCEERGDDEVSISPGISDVAARYATASSTEVLKEDPRDLDCYSDIMGARPIPGRNNELFRLEDPVDREVERNRRGSLTDTHKSAHHDESIPVSKAVDYKALFHQRPLQIPLSPISKPIKSGNPDEAWMKFILSDDNDYDVEEEYVKFNGNRKTTSPITIQLPSQSSVIVHLSENSTSSLPHEIATSSGVEAMTTPENTEGNVVSFSRDGPQLSSHATYGSNQPSSDEPLSDVPSSVDLIIHREAAPARFSSTAPSRATRKLTFTKPPRFPSPLDYGHESPETTGATAGSSSMHIGRSFSKKFDTLFQVKERDNGKRRGNRQRHCEQDIYSREEEYDVESIEDD